MSGSILEYRGQEAYWAALCAMDGLEMSDELPHPENADAEIGEILSQRNLFKFAVRAIYVSGVTVMREL